MNFYVERLFKYSRARYFYVYLSVSMQNRPTLKTSCVLPWRQMTRPRPRFAHLSSLVTRSKRVEGGSKALLETSYQLRPIEASEPRGTIHKEQ